MLVRFTYPTYALIGILISALQIGCALPETETLTDVANCEATETCDTNAPTCGNSQLDEGETCDDGNTDTETCPYGETYCTICDATCQEIVGQTSYCGDQVVDTENGEACDDGNTNEFDDCSSLCQFPLCGNGALDPGEECDDGNDIDTDGCTNVCQLPVCGDSIVSTTEECDDGNQVTETCSYGETSCEVCSNGCRIVNGVTSFCGDGITDSANGEGCDEGGANGLPTSSCRADCISTACGDGSVDVGEECDNGVENGGDGDCDDACRYQPYLLKDINTTNTSDSDGYVLGRLNDTLFIIAVNSTFQVLLYGYDINSSNYQILTQFDISDYFSVSSFKVGTGFVTSTHFYLFTELDDTSYLWRSDGTTSGTSLVKTIAAGCGRNSILCTGYTGAVLPIQIPEAEERIVFEGYDSIFGYGLWTSDGSPENTGPLYDSDSSSIRPLDPSYMVRHDDTVYFAARTDETGEELWKTDGTVEGTEITTQIIEGSGGTIFGMASVPAGIAISARSEDDGYEPHLYDGTSMRLLANVQPNGGSYPFDFAQINNKICYVAMSDEYGDEVFCSDLDQTEPNHYLLKNIGPEDSDSNPNTIVSTGERLFFFAKDQEADIYKLWTSDGSQANTIELFSDTDQILEDGRYEHTMVAMGNKVYFHAKDAETEKYGIFYSQGALANTQRLADVETPSASRTQYWLLSQDTLYFQGGVTEYGMEAWQTDGTTAGTTMIFDANPASNSALPPSTATLLGDKIFFIGDADGYGAEPYISDGTSAGTMRLKDINPNSESSAPQVLGVLGDQLIFSAYEPIGGRELWRTDGTAEGTEQIAEIVPGNGSYWISYAKVIGEHIYFGGEDEGGVQLWRTDGTLPGTQKVKEIYPGDDSYPRYFTAFGGQIYFQAESETHGKELWVTDGTENGTSLFADVEPGSSGSYPDNLMASSDHLFFVAEQGFNDYELWATDGNNAPQKLTSLMDGRTSDGVYLYNLATYNNHLYFAATTEAEGTELWKSDGTAAGTALFADFELGPNSSLPYVLYQDDDLLFLSVGTENQGRELWVVDMAAQSFALLKDIATGPANGIPNLNYRLYGAFTKGADGLYYFAASTENEGIELWRTDGTPNGTRLFKDLASGVIGSMPGSLKSTEGFLFFRALHTEFGYETWRYNFPETP